MTHSLLISMIFLLQLLVSCTVVSPVQLEPAKLVVFDTSDGFELAYRAYEPEGQAKAVLVFYHGSGALDDAGYQTLGHRLQQLGIATYMPEIRGFGYSPGERGAALEPERVWKNADEFIAFVRAQHKDAKMIIGGHSTGAGLTLNVVNSLQKPLQLDGVILLAPYFGYGPDIVNESSVTPFPNPDVTDFVFDGVNDEWFHDDPSAGFNFPNIVREKDPRTVDASTIAVSKSLTPVEAREALVRIEAPIGIWLGDNDVQFDTAKVVQFVLDTNPGAALKVIEAEGQLTVMPEAAEAIGKWILSLRQ